MKERHAYYMRRYQAITFKHKFMSIIVDGMAQSHNELPWCRNMHNFPHKLSQHLQGVLDHGSGTCTIYRIFHTVKKTRKP